MKKQIFLYLFIFAAMIALYQFVSAKNLVTSYDKQYNQLKEQLTQSRDSLEQLQIKVLESQYFSLENNDDALAYVEGVDNPSSYVIDKLLETNESKGDNPLVPYEGMEGDFKINKIKVLNHRWVLADFSDGKYWGELLMGFEIKEDQSVTFTLIDHLLYARS